MRKESRLPVIIAAVVILAALASCSEGGLEAGRALRKSVRLATTTSTDNSGLLEVLLPPFAEKYGIDVEVIAVGTGRAIKHGENGDVDLILVHSPEAEDRFVKGGFGVNRRRVMHNDFVIIGPAEDPAGLKGARDALEALRKIAASESLFISRGDDSGTHKKEKLLWQAAGLEPGGGWYVSAGQGMGAVLTMANEKQAYALSDRGTYLAYRSKLELPVLVEGDGRLFNPYSVIAVSPAKHPHVKYVEAMMLIAYLTSTEGQKIISSFRIDNEVLFYPDAIGRR